MGRGKGREICSRAMLAVEAGSVPRRKGSPWLLTEEQGTEGGEFCSGRATGEEGQGDLCKPKRYHHVTVIVSKTD